MRSSLFGKVAVLLFFAVSLLSFGGEVSAASEGSLLTTSCILANDDNYVGMPIPVEVVISNSSDRAVTLSNGERPDIIFTSENGSTRKKPPRVGSSWTSRILPPKSSKLFVCYPNRSIKFLNTGGVRLNYEITLRYRYLDEADNSTSKVEKINGVLEFKLKQADPVEAKKFLEKEMERFKSDDLRIEVDVAEAVCFMDDAIALDYIKEIASTKSELVNRIILESIWYNDSDEADKILLEMLQSDGSDRIVGTALDLLSDRDVEIRRQTIEALLASENSRIRWLTLSYIKRKKLGDYQDLVRDLVNDDDEKVSELAAAIMTRFESAGLDVQ